MKIHVSELEGRALDWAVGIAEAQPNGKGMMSAAEIVVMKQVLDGYSPSTDWGQCGPLLEHSPIDLEWYGVDGMVLGWFATCEQGSGDRYHGDTSLIAVCRAIVAAKLGEEVEIPDELVG